MRPRVGLTVAMMIGCATTTLSPGQDFRLLQSLSGPSGKVQGARFVLDEVRGRFVHPQDNSFVVFFEWEGPPGTHTLTGLWRRPDGNVDSMSPDVKIESTSRDLTCYWTYIIYPEMMPGVWALEVRIDGQPAGSHSFEIVGTAPRPATPVPVPAPSTPSLDQVFREASRSLVWVRRFDAAGKKEDTASGFILAKDRVVTALQAIDSTTKLEIEFAGGRKVETDEILAWSRPGDWAVVAVDTADLPALQAGDPKLVRVGERQIVFNVEGGARTIGGVDVSGRRTVAGYGERVQFSPPISPEATGGPLLDVNGLVVGILGGSVVPGERFERRRMSINPALGISVGGVSTATPVPGIAGMPDKATRLSELVGAGVLTAPLADMEGLLYVQTALEMTAKASDPMPRAVCEFSRRDKQVWVISEWLRKGKVSKGLLSAKVYDERNQVRLAVEPKKTSLQPAPMRAGSGFSPSALAPGMNRIDLIWDGLPVWRTFLRVVD